MTVAELLHDVRRVINDTGKIEYTDDELISYLNQAQDYIAETCANHQFKGILKATQLTLTDEKAQLPDDLISISVVTADGKKLNPITPGASYDENSYQVIGNTIYSKNHTVGLFYYAYWPRFSTTDDTVIAPRPFWKLLKEIAVYLALNRNEFNTSFETQLSILYEQKLLEVIANYGVSHIPLTLPFKV